MNDLPEECIAKILSLTTPRDVCRSSAVSRVFRSSADSDDVWKQFFPSDLPAGVAAPAGLPTWKRLFFSLVDNPLLLQDAHLGDYCIGALISSINRAFGWREGVVKKSYMMGARALDIAWGNDQRYWHWISLPNTRFTQVAELLMVWWLEIIGKLDVSLLSDDTLYAAFFVFKWNHAPYGFFQPVEASFLFPSSHITLDAHPSMVSLMQNPGNEEGHCPLLRRDGCYEVHLAVLRTDGWYEVHLGHLFKRRGDMGEIQMGLNETKMPFEKKDLILYGIEIRPIVP